jgi:2-keto-4-pentenoate hydratase/2-oxohepta-3-ene-1,7-dioic acid hydratase in catechol pathway
MPCSTVITAWAAIILGTLGAVARAVAAEPNTKAMRYLRFQTGDGAAYGLLEADRVRQLAGDLFGAWSKTDTTYALDEIKFLPPSVPTQVLALAGNYKSHLKDVVLAPKFQIPQPFFKSPSCLVGHSDAIVIPKDAHVVHHEGELVIVIGKKASKVAENQAMDYVFGVTCGNDVSERYWQNDSDNKDVQWWRAKGSDTFGPVGPYIATGIDYNNLLLRVRVNGEVKQEARTSELVQDVAKTVSFISRYITLQPGDLIFTGTPGTTSELKPNDVVEVDIEGIGVLRNRVVREK